MILWREHETFTQFKDWVSAQPFESLKDEALPQAISYWQEATIHELTAHNHAVTLWGVPYPLAYSLMQAWRFFVAQNSEAQIWIFTSHLPCFTYGRGLQKHKNPDIKLHPFNPHNSKLPFPLHEVERGGGLTFHYPGQMICYPIVKLQGAQRGLKWLTQVLLDSLQKTLAQLGLTQLHQHPDLLGLWVASHKIASIGISLRKMISAHGIAVNILEDPHFWNQLQDINPCGLQANIYTILENELRQRNLSNSDFTQLSHAWQANIKQELNL